MTLSKLISNNPIFASLRESDIENLTKFSLTRDYHEGTWIAHYGENWPYLFIVEEGSITLLKESFEGRSLIILDLEPGEVFWGLSFFLEDAPMPVALVAKTDSRLAMWSVDRLKPYLLKYGEMTWELSRTLVRRMQNASNIVDELAFQPVTGRLARLLLDHYGDAIQDYVARDMTLDEMAARIGTTLQALRRRGY